MWFPFNFVCDCLARFEYNTQTLSPGFVCDGTIYDQLSFIIPFLVLLGSRMRFYFFVVSSQLGCGQSCSMWLEQATLLQRVLRFGVFSFFSCKKLERRFRNKVHSVSGPKQSSSSNSFICIYFSFFKAMSLNIILNKAVPNSARLNLKISDHDLLQMLTEVIGTDFAKLKPKATSAL